MNRVPFPKGVKKFLARKKGEIRRSSLSPEEQEKEIIVIRDQLSAQYSKKNSSK